MPGALYCSDYISGNNGASGDPLVSKRPDFREVFKCWANMMFLYFCISAFFWISSCISGKRGATEELLVSKRLYFLGLIKCQQQVMFLDFCISGNLVFCFGFLDFLDFWERIRGTGDLLVSK